MICYFQESFKSSIKIKIEQQNRESVNFKEMVQRAINAKAKAGLRSTIIVQDLDIRCSQGHCPSNNTALKVQTQRTTAKNSFYPEESKTKDSKSVLLHNNLTEPAKKKDK